MKKRRSVRREVIKERTVEEKEKEKEKEKDRERSRDKEKSKTLEEKKVSKNDKETKEEKKKTEKILNNIILNSNEKTDQNNSIILPLENSSKDLNQYSSVHINKTELLDLLKCPLCKGYYRTPYTINECMHTFCKSCIFI